MARKRILVVMFLAFLVGGGSLFAQTGPNLTQLQNDFQQLTTDVANVLPTASTIGLNWSTAYVGQLLHFGVGVAGGAVFAPTTGFDKLAADPGIPNPLAQSGLEGQPGVGIPIPAAVVEARLGGLILPFDIGAKIGYIPSTVDLSTVLPGGMNVDFTMVGERSAFP